MRSYGQSRRLKELEAEGIIERRRSGTRRSWTYHLTPAGEEFAPILNALGVWGQRWSRCDLGKHEVSLTLLIWAIELSVKPDAFGKRRCIVKLTFTDQPDGMQHWWFINEESQAELCVKDPGFDVDLYLVTTLPDMIRIYRGDLPLARALDQGRIEAHGAAWARRVLSRWLVPSGFAQVRSQRADTHAA